MKKTLHSFQAFIFNKLAIFLLFITLASGCVEHDVALYTFKGDMIYSYLQKDTCCSEYLKIVTKAGFKGLLSAYVQYTCFAPTNAAMNTYYHSLGARFTIDSLRSGQIDTLARAHIVPNRYHTYEFENGIIPSTNMNCHFVNVQFDSVAGGILLNGSSRIISKDNEVYNGIVHGIDRVFKILTGQLPNLMAENKDVSIFSEALSLTHLSDSISPIIDLSHKPPKAFLFIDDFKSIEYSTQRKYGYTAFVEDNRVLKANGINSLSDLVVRAKELYPASSQYDNDFTNRNNSLNRYIAYHLINKAIYKNKFFYTRNAVPGFVPDEFLETMLPNRIIRVSNIGGQITLNPGTNQTTSICESENKMALNGVYHLLDRMLVYTDNVEQMLQNTRIRFDVSSLFPELTNNNIRGTDGQTEGSSANGNHFFFESGYLKDLKMSKDTRFYYAGGIGDGNPYSCFQTDNMQASGLYDITIRLLPVPPGTYELRFGFVYSSTIAQIYVDNKPIGIPVNFCADPSYSLGQDNETDDDGLKIDQILHYLGYMKAPTTIMCHKEGGVTARDGGYLRKVVGIFSFTEFQAHTLRIRSTLDVRSDFFIDYVELVPKSVFDPPGDEPETRD